MNRAIWLKAYFLSFISVTKTFLEDFLRSAAINCFHFFLNRYQTKNQTALLPQHNSLKSKYQHHRQYWRKKSGRVLQGLMLAITGSFKNCQLWKVCLSKLEWLLWRILGMRQRNISTVILLISGQRTLYIKYTYVQSCTYLNAQTHWVVFFLFFQSLYEDFYCVAFFAISIGNI